MSHRRERGLRPAGPGHSERRLAAAPALASQPGSGGRGAKRFCHRAGNAKVILVRQGAQRSSTIANQGGPCMSARVRGPSAERLRINRRAEQQAESRRRIVEAAVDLHSSVGPAFTILSMIAERAGVQRHTLYAHLR